MSDDKPAPPWPDRLSVDPAGPHHAAAVFEHENGIRSNDRERHDVEEDCITLLIKPRRKFEALHRRGARVLDTVESPLHRLRATDS